MCIFFTKIGLLQPFHKIGLFGATKQNSTPNIQDHFPLFRYGVLCRLGIKYDLKEFRMDDFDI